MNQQLGENVSFIAVEPGSPEDPFSAHSSVSSPPAVASPAIVPAVGATPNTPAEGPQAPQTQAPSPTSAPAPVSPPAPSQPAPEAETPLQKALREGNLDEYIAGLVSQKVEPIARAQQSSYDKRINDLQQQLREAREAEIRREREGKLANEDLTDEEKALLREKWTLEDEKAQLAADIEEGDRYFRSMYVAGLVQEAQQFGVTAEQLEQFDEPEEMDAFVARAELDWYKSGHHLTAQVPNNAVQANPTGSAPAANPQVAAAPAGASAPTDVGGGAPAAPAAKPEQGTGIDVMARNLNNSEWVVVPLPN